MNVNYRKSICNIVKREVVTKNFYNFCTHFLKIGVVLFWQREHFSSKGPFTYDVSTLGGEGVNEMLTFSDMGEGGLTNDDISKKGNFSAIATNA